MKAIVVFLTLLMVTGCSTLSPTLLANQATQATTAQTAKLDTPLLAQASPSPQSSQPAAIDRQNQLVEWGYAEGNEAGRRDLPSSPWIGISFHNVQPTEEKTYTDAYDRGYADAKGTSPPPITVSPARRAELQQKGNQEGAKDAGLNLAANPGSGITVLGLTDQTEIQIYTDAYNAGYQRQTTPLPISLEQLAQLRQQGYGDGYAEAQSGLSKDASRSSNFQSLVTTAEQQAYTNGYNNGYQRYLDERDIIIGGW